MKKIDSIFILKINPVLKGNIEEIIKFQIKRIEFYFSKSIHIWDPNNILQNIPKYSLIKSSTEIELNKFLKSKRDKIFFFIESINPFLDDKLIKQLNKEDVKGISSIENAIPGTYPTFIIQYKDLMGKIDSKNWWSKLKSENRIDWNTQRQNNNQFNLNRPLRVKIFLELLKKIANLEKMSLEKFLKILDSNEIYNFILDYAVSGLRTKEIKKCPHCKNNKLIKLFLTTSQPMIGFLSSKKPLYYECKNCGLVILRKQCIMKDVHLLYDEFERPKTDEKQLIENYLKNKGKSHFKEKIRALELLEKKVSKKTRMIDLGGGFGEFSSMAKKRNPDWNVTCADFNLDHVKKILDEKKVSVMNINFLQNNFGKNYDVITSLHVIEHIPFEGLELYLNNIHSALKHNGYFLLSTPDYNSDLGRMFDYHMMYPPHHQTILSNQWITEYLLNKKLFKKIDQMSACVILENYNDWFSYYKETTPTQESKAVVEIFNEIHGDSKMFNKLENTLSKKNKGSETIILFKKIS